MNITEITRQIRTFADQLDASAAPEPQPDPYVELKKAHAEGKVIQYRDASTGGVWQTCTSPGWFNDAEYRIKPEPAFQLPPPPPGMQWHRTDMWQEGDLPQGMRPLVYGETRLVGDEFFPTEGCDIWRNKWQTAEEGFFAQTQNSVNRRSYKSRTTRPLTFQHAGKTWTYHRPGDPRPCDAGRWVQVVMMDGHVSPDCNGEDWDWAAEYTTSVHIIGWRYADEKKTVPLGPEDAPPGSVFRINQPGLTRHGYCVADCVDFDGCEFNSRKSHFGTALVGWGELSDGWQINRSIPLTGKWNPDAWEPCHKQIDA